MSGLGVTPRRAATPPPSLNGQLVCCALRDHSRVSGGDHRELERCSAEPDRIDDPRLIPLMGRLEQIDHLLPEHLLALVDDPIREDDGTRLHTPSRGLGQRRSTVSLLVVVLEQRPQFQRRPHLAVGHQRADAIALAIELPRNNRCARFAALALLTANTSFTCLAAAAWPALSAQQLPAVTGTQSRIIATSNESSTIERDDVEPLVLFTRIVCAADVRLPPIASVAT